MYDYIRGKVTRSTPLYTVLDVSGVGYRIAIPTNAFPKIDIGEELTLHVSFIVREQSHSLFGFLNAEERDLFEVLLGVSGIGPKTALGVIGGLDAETLRLAVSDGNVATISKVPGIGKKTAERLILEIKDKLPKMFPHLAENFAIQISNKKQSPIVRDAHSALTNLGYKDSAVEKALSRIMDKDATDHDLASLITQALKVL
ncbi:MAG: Holliday junction branch migration protein RuvA [Waddliaceae bacterium]|nr:Holliday junction branch migration protein RuvA [Waddliaceae bacterium]